MKRINGNLIFERNPQIASLFLMRYRPDTLSSERYQNHNDVIFDQNQIPGQRTKASNRMTATAAIHNTGFFSSQIEK